MSRQLVLCFLLLLGLPGSASLRAAVFERDWLEPGDGLLTYDDVNQREWLDLTESLARNIGQTDSSGTFSFDYQRDLLDELEPGGEFEGFQAATTADVVALALSAGIDPNTSDFATNGVPAGALIDLLGPTFGIPIVSGGIEASAFGMTVDLVVISGDSVNDIVEVFYDDENTSVAGLRPGQGSDRARSNTVGMMLFRQVVPEPTSIALVMTSCFFPLRRFRRCEVSG